MVTRKNTLIGFTTVLAFVAAFASLGATSDPPVPNAAAEGDCGSCYNLQDQSGTWYHAFSSTGDCSTWMEECEENDCHWYACVSAGQRTCESEGSSHMWCHHGAVLGFCSEHWDCPAEDGDGNCLAEPGVQ